MAEITRSVDNPSGLTEREKLGLVAVCYPLVCGGFGQQPNDKLYAESWNEVINCHHLWLHESDSGLFAFSTWYEFELDGSKILYLGAVMVAPEFQGKGFVAKTIVAAWEKYPSSYLAAETQNPILYTSLQRAGFLVYPNATLESPESIKKIALGLTLTLGWGVKDEHNPQLRRGAYGRCLYGTRPICRNIEIERFFSTNLNFERGDAFLLVAEKPV